MDSVERDDDDCVEGLSVEERELLERAAALIWSQYGDLLRDLADE